MFSIISHFISLINFLVEIFVYHALLETFIVWEKNLQNEDSKNLESF